MDPSHRRNLLGNDVANDLEDNDTDHARSDRSPRREDDEVHQQHGGRMRRLEDILAVGRPVGAGTGAPLPLSPTPSSESAGTISNDNRGASSAGVGGVARKLACHVCGKVFSTSKAVNGHMKVHSSGSGTGGRQLVASVVPALSAGWATTGRRGCIGGKPSAAPASTNSVSTGHSSANVAVQVKPLQPLPMAIAKINLSGKGEEGSSSGASATATAQPMHLDEPVAAAVVTGANPSFTGAGAGAGAGARAGPVDHQLPAAADQAPAPQVHRQAVPVPPPAAPKGQLAQQPLFPPPPAAAVQLQQGGQLMPRPAQPPREYSCKDCGQSFSTHQGLGGHAAGHKNRQREQEAMAAAGGGEFLAALRRGRREEQSHVCQKCQKVFPTGVALGGHMRMHYTGPTIVHKSKKSSAALVSSVLPPPPAVTEADLRAALQSTITQMEEPSSSTAPAVAGTGILRLFGIDIGPLALGQQAPSEQQGSGTTEDSSAADEQQHK